MTDKTFQLTERDLQVLIDLYKMKYLSVSQIRKLHFPSDQTAYRRLRALRSLGFAKSFNVPNINEGVFYLSQPGAELAAEQFGLSNSDLRIRSTSTTPKDYYFLRHFLSINDFRIALTQACDNSPIKLLGFIPEYVGERRKYGGVKKYIRDVVSDVSNGRDTIGHTPDAVFALERNGKSALFFLEVDRGTESMSSVSKGIIGAITFYLNYLATGHYRRYVSEFQAREFRGFRALILTSSRSRVYNLRLAGRGLEYPANAKRLIWVAEGSLNFDENPLSKPWLSLDHEDAAEYKIT